MTAICELSAPPHPQTRIHFLCSRSTLFQLTPKSELSSFFLIHHIDWSPIVVYTDTFKSEIVRVARGYWYYQEGLWV